MRSPGSFLSSHARTGFHSDSRNTSTDTSPEAGTPPIATTCVAGIFRRRTYSFPTRIESGESALTTTSVVSGAPPPSAPRASATSAAVATAVRRGARIASRYPTAARLPRVGRRSYASPVPDVPATKSVPALVLIYDIRGFTSASKRMRTADIGAFATAAHRTILDLFSERPPTFVKNLGDGHLLLWETGSEPDPTLLEHVVRGAARARTTFAAFATGQEAGGAVLPKHVGLGIAFGEVSRSDDYYGTALNLAARLQNLARPEGMAMDATVFDAVSNRDAALADEFSRAKVRLKGLGQTLVWVKRPFSWGRLFATVGKVAAVLAVVFGYVARADSGLSVPGGVAIRRFVDRHDASLLRPIRSDAEVREAAAGTRRRLAEALREARSKDGWVFGSFLDDMQREI